MIFRDLEWCFNTFFSFVVQSPWIPIARSTCCYRHIQILTVLNNEVQQKSLMTFVFLCAILCQAVTMTSLVILTWSSENAFSICLFLILNLEAAGAILVYFTGVASVYTVSKSAIDQLKKRLRFHSKTRYRKSELKQRQKFYESCAPLKIRFGTVNFVDALTPLHSMELANNLTIQLLLLNSWNNVISISILLS